MIHLRHSMHRAGIREVGLVIVFVFLLQACTLGGTGIGMAVSPPGQPPHVDTLVVEPGTLTRETLMAKLDVQKGASIWVTHNKRTQVTMGTYAGIAPEDGPKRIEKRGWRTLVWVPRTPPGIRVDTGSTVVVVPFAEVSAVRLETPHRPYWLIGTSVGFVVDALLVLAWLALPHPFGSTRGVE